MESELLNSHYLIWFVVIIAIAAALTRRGVRYVLRDSNKSEAARRLIETLAAIGVIGSGALLLVLWQG